MPTTYTGDPVGAATPDIAPEPETAVVVNIPIATEGRTVSSIDQFVKALANQVSWLKKVKAKASAWTGLIWATRTALGHRRAGFDHLGLPGGRIVHVTEDWSQGVDASVATAVRDITGGYGSLFVSNLASTGTALLAASLDAGLVADYPAVAAQLATAGVALGSSAADARAMQGASPWRYRLEDAGAGTTEIQFLGPDTAVQPRHRYVKLVSADTAGDLALLYRKAPVLYDNDLHLVMEWEAKLSAANTVKCEAAGGLSIENTINTGASQGSDFALFVIGPGGGNWGFQRRSAGGAVANVDTGVAASTNWVRFRIELHGSVVADDTTRALRAYMNGVKVVDVTTTIPASTVAAAPTFSVNNTVGGSGGAALFVGPVKVSHNLYGSDVF